MFYARQYARRAPLRYARSVSGYGSYYARPPFYPPQRYVSGRGSYASRLVKRTYNRAVNRKTQSKYLAPALGMIGGGIGAMRGGKAGALIGQGVGNAIGSAIHQVTGLGSYKVRSNVLYEGAQIPKVVNNPSTPGGTTIRHKEYLCDIITSSVANTFNLQNFFINPGQSATFPWLSQVAQNYEEYILEGCLFEFRTMSADALNSTNTALGTVIMATEYNAANPNFQSKAEMESYEFAMSDKPSCSMIHPIECDPRQTPIPNMYVRPTALPSGQDQRLYDLGNFQIATTGMQGTSVNIGELWVSYQVTLLKPKLYQALGLDNGYYHSSSTTGVTNAAPLGTAQSPSSGSNLAVTITSGTTINFPQTQAPANYLIYIRWVGGAVAWVVPTVSAGGSTSLNSNILPGGTLVAPQAALAGTTTCQMEIHASCQGQYTSNSVVIGGAGTLPTSVSAFQLIIVQVPNNAN